MKVQRNVPGLAAHAKIERILVVVNRLAGGVKRRPGIVEELAAIVGDRGEVAVTGSPDELRQILMRARSRGVDTIGICGGDGTNLATLTALANVYGR
jgi:diacylglycerol kinase (ATP)